MAVESSNGHREIECNHESLEFEGSPRKSLTVKVQNFERSPRKSLTVKGQNLKGHRETV